ncbi:ABC transporter ATP-binding protein [Clostridium sp. MT-14]|uniref:ABC transporter ATP-binding protein n=1 Tax=Clostridium sp. MT-14 TaxID=3348360 RepID=UPI0035F35F17
MNNILEVEGLNKYYKNFSLSNLSFTLPEGCIAGFIGINGTGKTTTIRTILGLSKKTSGSVKIFGKDIEHNEHELKNRIGVVFDEGFFYDELTMAEMKSIISPAYSGWSERDYRAYMERFCLDPRQKISTLSKGMRMKFALTLALSHGAELLIMDEPTSGLDPLIRSQFLDIMADYMKRGGKGVLFSTHIISDLDKIADMIILIHKGEILFEKEKDYLLDNYRLIKGDKRYVDESSRNLFLKLTATDFGFTGITHKIYEVKKNMKDILVERPTIEDIMLAYIGGGEDNNAVSSH